MKSARALALLLAGVGSAQAQTVSLETTPAPHYAGESIEIHVVAEGFDEEPAPTIAFGSPARGKLVAAGVRPSVSTSISIINGQVQRSKQVSFRFVYQLQVDEPGPLSIGPFAVAQGSRRASSGALELDLLRLPSSDQMGVELEIPSTPIFVGERVPVLLRFRLTGRLRENLHQYVLRVPFFGMTDSFQFLEPPEGAGTTKLEVQTPTGTIAMLGTVREEVRDGDAYLSVEIRRIAVPLRAGTLAIPAATLDVEEGIRFTRDLFGGRRPTQLRKWRSADAAREIAVKPIPAENTPPSFAGAVGSGFSLAVSADRTVVKVGEPIVLRFELRGDGNLETAALPRLDAEGMLPRESFRVAEGEIPGSVEDGVKRFTASVRVIDPQLREIPALEYAWFDPVSQSFQIARSLPIALSVGDARTVGAADVLSGEPAPAEPPHQPAPDAAQSDASDSALELTGADLAIERDASRLLRRTAGASGQAWALSGIYASSCLVLLLAHWDRRRRNVDPALLARRRQRDTELRRIRDASALPAAEGAAEIARALRALLASSSQPRQPEIDALIGECDARSYAPAAQRDRAALEPALAQRALEVATQLCEREP